MSHTPIQPGHHWLHRRIVAGELALQHLVVETFFFRGENKNALGEPRDWTDHLLWHHACHTVDLFGYQTDAAITEGREPNASVSQALETMRVLDRLEKSLNP